MTKERVFRAINIPQHTTSKEQSVFKINFLNLDQWYFNVWSKLPINRVEIVKMSNVAKVLSVENFKSVINVRCV